MNSFLTKGLNSKMQKQMNFVQNNNIKFIHDIPYNPHSQGTIERFHYTIKKYLAKEFISNNYQKIIFLK